MDSFKKALLKHKREMTIPEIFQLFLKIRLPTDIKRPVLRHFLRRNTAMENQFNRKHGAVQHMFLPGQSMLAKDYHDDIGKWCAL